MITLESEIEALRPLLGDRVTNVLIARERREVFSIYPELRLCAWAGVMLLATAAGIVLKNNLERIGPLALATMMGLAAAACYAWAWWRRTRGSLVDDYVLLLGALLLSADAGYIETQFHLLGDSWQRHFLFLALAHGIAAYVFHSRMVLSLSITALAAWLGIEQRLVLAYGTEATAYASRAFVCAALLLIWRAIDRRRRPSDFSPVFEHFAALVAFVGAFALMQEDHALYLGCMLVMAIAAIVIAWGFRTQSEWFVLYSFLFGVIALDVLVFELLEGPNDALAFFFVVLSSIAAIIGLILIHARFRARRLEAAP